MNAPNKTIPISQVHTYLGLDRPLTPRQIRYWRKTGFHGSRLTMYQCGRAWITTERDVEKFLSEQKPQ